MLMHEGVCRFNPKFKYMTFMYRHHIDLYPSSTGLIEPHKGQLPVNLIDSSTGSTALASQRSGFECRVQAWIFQAFLVTTK